MTTSVEFPTAEEIAELLRLHGERRLYLGHRTAPGLTSPELDGLLAAASFALDCAEFLQEWRPALLGLARERSAKAITTREQFVANRFETELADLLRSLPARDEAGRDV